jgi:hypothetical protein
MLPLDVYVVIVEALDAEKTDSLRVYRQLLAVPRFGRLTVRDNRRWRRRFTIYFEDKRNMWWMLNDRLHREERGNDGELLPALITTYGPMYYQVIDRQYFIHGKECYDNGTIIPDIFRLIG